VTGCESAWSGASGASGASGDGWHAEVAGEGAVDGLEGARAVLRAESREERTPSRAPEVRPALCGRHLPLEQPISTRSLPSPVTSSDMVPIPPADVVCGSFGKCDGAVALALQQALFNGALQV
jgi:hypothetical protein